MNDFLPVGSVVLLKSGKKPISIIGYKMSSLDNKYLMNGHETTSNKVYDYCAVLYPEGLISSDNFILFDKENIETVIFKGYESDDCKELFDFLSKE